MSENTTLDAIQYAQSVHLAARHATALQVDVGCPECLALARAAQAAAAAVPPPARTVPPARRATR
jgi:hypothetical protein